MTSAGETDSLSPPSVQSDDPAESLGYRLRMARRSGGLSRGELADKLGLKVKAVKAWERNQAEPRPDKMTKLAGVLNVSLKWLLTGDDAEHQGPTGGPNPRSGRPLSHDLAAVVTELRAIRAEQLELANRLARLDHELQHLEH